MKHVKLYEEFEYETGRKAPVDTSKNFSVSVVTEEAIERAKKKNPNRPISTREVGYHFSPIPYADAVAKKQKLEKEGTYKGEKIQSVTLSPASDRIGEMNEGKVTRGL